VQVLEQRLGAVRAPEGLRGQREERLAVGVEPILLLPQAREGLRGAIVLARVLGVRASACSIQRRRSARPPPRRSRPEVLGRARERRGRRPGRRRAPARGPTRRRRSSSGRCRPPSTSPSRRRRAGSRTGARATGASSRSSSQRLLALGWVLSGALGSIPPKTRAMRVLGREPAVAAASWPRSRPAGSATASARCSRRDSRSGTAARRASSPPGWARRGSRGWSSPCGARPAARGRRPARHHSGAARARPARRCRGRGRDKSSAAHPRTRRRARSARAWLGPHATARSFQSRRRWPPAGITAVSSGAAKSSRPSTFSSTRACSGSLVWSSISAETTHSSPTTKKRGAARRALSGLRVRVVAVAKPARESCASTRARPSSA
jgi:hypothetical protein